MNFKIGDRVICVDVSNERGCLPLPLQLHKEYDVIGMMFCAFCGKQFIDVNVKQGGYVLYIQCQCENELTKDYKDYWDAPRFIKIDEIESTISELLKETQISVLTT